MQIKQGFTLIELMLTIVVFAIIVFGALAFTRSSLVGANFNTTVSEIKRAMLTAQNRALESYENTTSGVYFDEGQMVVFTDDEYDELNSLNLVFALPPTITVNTLDFDVNDSVVFEKYTGLPVVDGSIEIESDSGEIAIISVNDNGVISISYE